MRVTDGVQKHIIESLGDKVVESGEFQKDFWLKVHGKDLLAVVQFLRDDSKSLFDGFIDVCGVDYLTTQPRFESVIHLYSMQHKHRIRIRTLVDDKTLTVPSLTNMWKGADWHEREAFDMYGIKYDGHPNLLRILSAPGVEVFAQRKDYPLKGVRAIDEDLE
ncbi:MAG: NADH-quinone oxidoreductase subunit C [Proteobacteria bacterium]|jgi:NADH/F420H2 dehydrogenase subunit C|nr:NADH-quinone oxidoreductase subunit C [Pseudomonadota bacterium]